MASGQVCPQPARPMRRSAQVNLRPVCTSPRVSTWPCANVKLTGSSERTMPLQNAYSTSRQLSPSRRWTGTTRHIYSTGSRSRKCPVRRDKSRRVRIQLTGMGDFHRASATSRWNRQRKCLCLRTSLSLKSSKSSSNNRNSNLNRFQC